MGLGDILGSLLGGGTPKQGQRNNENSMASPSQPGQQFMQAPEPEKDDGGFMKVLMSLFGG
jgi:hypothetical protein